MITTPWIRLSEDVISKAIRQFYKDRLPLGVTTVALSDFSDRMAAASKKLVERFRKVFRETPSGAKLASIAALKKRLVDVGVEPSQGDAAEPAQATSQDLQQVAPADGFDWDKLRLALVNLAKNKQEAQEPPKARPVATPARNALPDYVLKALDKETEPVKPFKTVDEETDCDEDEIEKNGKEKKTKQKKKGEQKKKAEPKKNAREKKGKPVIAGPEEETALALEDSAMSQVVKTGSDNAYKAGSLNEARLHFIQAVREQQKVPYKRAQELWTLSSERSDLLSGLSDKELKRRRFLSCQW